MSATGPAGPSSPVEPSGLLDVLNVASVVLDAEGRIVLWSPQAEALFGWPAAEALGRYAARVMVHEQHVELVVKLFADVMATGRSWAGAFPVRRKDGTTRLVEFRNMRLLDDRGDVYALGLAADHTTVRGVERDVALSTRMIEQSPIGLAVVDTDLRYVSVNPALARINGLNAGEHIGRRIREVLPAVDAEALEAAVREVLRTGVPLVDRQVVGRTAADPHEEHAWSVSLYRLEDTRGTVLGVAASVVDITDEYRAGLAAEAARRRLALIADASARIGTTLDLERTARELAEVAVPELADVAAVDLLDSVVTGRPPGPRSAGPAAIRVLAVRDGDAPHTPPADDPPGEWVTRCVRTGEPVLVTRTGDEDDDLARVASGPRAHSCLAVPLVARGEVLGALDLRRTANPLPFGTDDVLLAKELAARAAVQIDNARWYRNARTTALTLQRSLLPSHPALTGGLEVASRYQPADATTEVGGDWFDVIPLPDGKTALVVGDVMGSGVDAAATMGRLRTATTTLAGLDLDPAVLMEHLDRITEGLDQSIATCLYAVHDPGPGRCRIANAGHLPPARVRPGRPPELLDLPTGVPLGVGGVAFSTTEVDFAPGDQLVLYTDGLVETRVHSLDERLDALLGLLGGPERPLEELCDLLLSELHHPDNHDDVAVLVARARTR